MNKASVKVVLDNVRCSYVFVAQPRKKESGEDGGYGLQVLLKKNDKQLKKCKKAIDHVLEKAFGKDALKKRGRYKLPLRDAEDEGFDGEEYENVMFFNANSYGRRPGVINQRKEPADEHDMEDYCYSGAYMHVSINFYAFPAKDGGKPGIAVGLNNIMLHRKGDRLDGSTTASQDFADYEEADFDVDDDFDDDL